MIQALHQALQIIVSLGVSEIQSIKEWGHKGSTGELVDGE